MMKNDFVELEVCNINETRIQLGCKISDLVVTFNVKKLLRMIDLDNCDYIT